MSGDLDERTVEAYMLDCRVNPDWSDEPAGQWGVTSGMTNEDRAVVPITVIQRGQMRAHYSRLSDEMMDSDILYEVGFFPTTSEQDAIRLAAEMTARRTQAQQEVDSMDDRRLYLDEQRRAPAVGNLYEGETDEEKDKGDWDWDEIERNRQS
jgi:hypothetical protein